MVKNGLFSHEMLDLCQEMLSHLTYNNPVIILDSIGNISQINRFAAEMIGDKETDLIGKVLEQVFPEILQFDDRMGLAEKEQLIYGQTYRIHSLPVANESTGICGKVLFFQDMSYKTQLAPLLEEVRDLNNDMLEILEALPDGIYITDGESRTLFMNESCGEAVGLTKQDVMGRKMAEIVDEGKLSSSATLEVLKNNKRSSVLQTVPNGKTVLVTGTPLLDDKGEIRLVVSATRDITELNHLKNQIDHESRLKDRYYKELIALKTIDMAKISNALDSVRSKNMFEVIQLALQVADTNSTVLIQGESGVGKDVIARLIFNESSRNNKPFIKINCAAIPDNLLESELFGYEDGAFTGAKKGGKAGLIEMANKGTIFLDEIGEMPVLLQPKLLQVIQEKTYLRVGGIKTNEVDVRIIAATNRDLEERIKEGKFRADLYYRLNVIPIHIKPLRDRIEDIPPLAFSFLTRFNEQYDRNKILSNKAIDVFQKYTWPGNVRELENLIERMVIIGRDDHILPEQLPKHIRSPHTDSQVMVKGILPLYEAIEELEKQLCLNVYNITHNTYKVAEILGISQPTAVRKLNKLKEAGLIQR